MKILITGGCGFIGSNFIRYMLSVYKNVRIVNLDKLTYCGNPENLADLKTEDRYEFIKGDICDPVVAGDLAGEVDYVVNFAAETHVDRSIKYPEDFLRTNVSGVRNLMDSCRKAGTKKFIQIGTDEVYGDILSGRSRESDPLKPNSPYAASKAAADLLALAYYRTYSFPVTVVRSSNNFGPYQYPEKVIPLFITNLLEGRKVPLYGTGKNVREWLFVKDNCAAIDLVLRDGEIGSIYNIGGGNDLSNLDLTGKILATMDRGEDCIEHVKDRPGHDMRYSLDSSRIKELGWEPSDDMQKDLEYTVNWYSENTSWWKPLKEKAEIINW